MIGDPVYDFLGAAKALERVYVSPTSRENFLKNQSVQDHKSGYSANGSVLSLA